MGDLGEAIVGCFIIIIGLAFTLGALAMWAVPKLWELVKPFLHMITT